MGMGMGWASMANVMGRHIAHIQSGSVKGDAAAMDITTCAYSTHSTHTHTQAGLVRAQDMVGAGYRRLRGTAGTADTGTGRHRQTDRSCVSELRAAHGHQRGEVHGTWYTVHGTPPPPPPPHTTILEPVWRHTKATHEL
ncbi:hypothetical protein DM02DRAFT_420208 [Periconia macrospinosa]|uniref:Uncharacterized protein n=1 Tax=Periconia macrospinosa TaxID=97972 RepID=A0A2V1DN92_9PLEO|nr:hypothetical protein DM02DRAFT_420208 [Periconia macrospinosa]